MPELDGDLRERVITLEAELDRLRSLVDTLSIDQAPSGQKRLVRLARTVPPAGGAYADEKNNTFDIVFLNAYFPLEAGQHEPTIIDRQNAAEPIHLLHHVNDEHILEGRLVAAFENAGKFFTADNQLAAAVGKTKVGAGGIDAGASGPVTIYRAGLETTEEVIAHHDWMTGAQRVSEDKQVLVVFFPREGFWRVIGAECETAQAAPVDLFQFVAPDVDPDVGLPSGLETGSIFRIKNTTSSTTNIDVTAFGGETAETPGGSQGSTATLSGAFGGWVYQLDNDDQWWLVSDGAGSIAIGSAIGTAAAGSVLFVDAATNLGQDNANLYWDESNTLLGLGINSSLAGRLQVVTPDLSTPGIVIDGVASQSEDLQQWRNNSGTVLALIDKDGQAQFNLQTAPATFNVGANGKPNALRVRGTDGRVSIHTTSAGSALNIGGDRVLSFIGGNSTIYASTNILTLEAGILSHKGESRFAAAGVGVDGSQVNITPRATTVGALAIKQLSGGTEKLVRIYDSSGVQTMGMTLNGLTTAGSGNGIARLDFEHTVTPASADGDGAGINLRTEDSGGNLRDIAFIDAVYTDISAHQAALVLSLKDDSATNSVPAERLRITHDGDLLIGTTTYPTANNGKVLVFGDNAADPTMGTNTAGLFAKDVSGTVEMWAVDEGGTATQISPHDEHGDWIHYAENNRTGKRVRIDVERFFRDHYPEYVTYG